MGFKSSVILAASVLLLITIFVRDLYFVFFQILCPTRIFLSIPCPGRIQIQGATHNIAELCQLVCQSHELILEHVWKIRMLLILIFLSEVVISYFIL